MMFKIVAFKAIGWIIILLFFFKLLQHKMKRLAHYWTVFCSLFVLFYLFLFKDTRMDSPGFYAQYCTYIAIDNDSKHIISMGDIDKQETQRNSVAMEKEGFMRTFDTLHQELNVSEIYTDANSQIYSLFSKWIYGSFLLWLFAAKPYITFYIILTGHYFGLLHDICVP